MGHHRPTIFQDPDPFGTQINHGLDGKCHARLEFGPRSFPTVVWNLRFLVKFAPHPVAYEFPYDAEALTKGLRLDVIGKIPQSSSRDSIGNGPLQDSPRGGANTGMREEAAGGSIAKGNANCGTTRLALA